MGMYFLGTYNHYQTFFWEKVEESLEEHLLGTYICKYYILVGFGLACAPSALRAPVFLDSLPLQRGAARPPPANFSSAASYSFFFPLDQGGY
jgi:hypothetical protein